MAPRFDDYDSMTRLGDIVIKAAKTLGRRIAVIASGDLSHRLLQGSPNGYTPNGAVFDKLVMEPCSNKIFQPQRPQPQLHR